MTCFFVYMNIFAFIYQRLSANTQTFVCWLLIQILLFFPHKKLNHPFGWLVFLAGAIGFASLEPPDKQFTELFTLREICRANFLPIRILLFFPTKKINTPFWACHFFGRGNRIRTYDHGVRVRGLTAWRYPYFLYFIKLL